MSRKSKPPSRREKKSSGVEISNSLFSILGDGDPDETVNDFSGSFTPYKKFKETNAKKKSLKTKLQNIKLTAEAADDEALPDLVVSRRGKSSADVDKECKRVCEFCKRDVARESYALHLKTCLSMKFKRGTVSNKEVFMCEICEVDISGLTMDERTEHINKCIDIDSVKDAACPFCHKHLGHLNVQRRTQHVNKCAQQVEQDAAKQKAFDDAIKRAQNKVLNCPLCGKTFKSKTSRVSHLKKCSKELNVSPQTLRTCVTEQNEKHENKIATGDVTIVEPKPVRKRRAPTKRLIPNKTHADEPQSAQDEAMQLALAMSTSLNEDVVCGPKPEDHQQMQPSHSTNLKTSSKQQGSLNAFDRLLTPKTANVKPVKQPKERAKKRIDLPSTLVPHHSSYQRVLAEKVAQEILPTEDLLENFRCTPEMPTSGYCQPTKLWDLATLFESESKENICDDQSDLTTRNAADKHLFYTSTLRQHVSVCDVEAGSKIKSLAKLAGYKHVEEDQREKCGKMNHEIVNTQKQSSQLNDTTLIASTQTAVLLAELDITQDTTILDNTIHKPGKSVHTSGNSVQRVDIGVNTDATTEMSTTSAGFTCTSSIQTHRNTSSTLSSDLSFMVNNKTLSDVEIEVADHRVLYAHKFILYARCKSLKQQFSDSPLGVTSRLQWHSDRYDDAHFVLHYIYTAELSTSVILSNYGNVLRLSKRLQLPDLERDLETILKQKRPEELSSEQHLQEMLVDVWGSDADETQDSITCAEASHKEDIMPPQSPVDLFANDSDDLENDIQEYAMTQRNKVDLELASDTSECHSEAGHSNTDLDTKIVSDDTGEQGNSSDSDDLMEVIENENDLDEYINAITHNDSDSCGNISDSKSAAQKQDSLNTCTDIDSRQTTCVTLAKEQENPVETLLPSHCSAYVNHPQLTPEHSQNSPRGEQFTPEHSPSSPRAGQLTPEHPPNSLRDGQSTPDLFASSPDATPPRKNIHDSVNTPEKCSSTKLTHNKDVINVSQSPHVSGCERISTDYMDSSEHVIDLTSSNDSVNNELVNESLVNNPIDVECGHLDDDRWNLTLESDEEGHTPDVAQSSEDNDSLPNISLDEQNESLPDILFDIPDNDENLDDQPPETELEQDVACSYHDKSTEIEKTEDVHPDISSNMRDQEINTKNLRPEKELHQNVSAPCHDNETGIDQPEGNVQPVGTQQGRKKFTFKKVPTTLSQQAGEQAREQIGDDVSIKPQDYHQENKLLTSSLAVSDQDKRKRISSGSDEEVLPLMARLRGQLPENKRRKTTKAQCEKELSDTTPAGSQSNDELYLKQTKINNIPEDGKSSGDDIQFTEALSRDDVTSEIHETTFDDDIYAEFENDCNLSDFNVSKLKTPDRKLARKPVKNQCSPFTPMSDYEVMKTPQLKSRCEKFGVRLQGKKKMKNILKHIYEQTHQYETDSDDDFCTPLTQVANDARVDKARMPPPSLMKGQTRNVATKTVTAGKSSTHTMTKVSRSASQIIHNISDSSDSDTETNRDFDVLEESYMYQHQPDSEANQVDEDKIAFTQGGTKMTKEQKTEHAKSQIQTYIRRNKSLYARILQYEPLEFESLKAELQSACGTKFSTPLIMDFLDEQNIQFTLKNSEKGLSSQNRRKKKYSKSASQKNT